MAEPAPDDGVPVERVHFGVPFVIGPAEHELDWCIAPHFIDNTPAPATTGAPAAAVVLALEEFFNLERVDEAVSVFTDIDLVDLSHGS